MIWLEVKTDILKMISLALKLDMIWLEVAPDNLKTWCGRITINFGKWPNHQLFKILSLCNTPKMNNLILHYHIFSRLDIMFTVHYTT